MADVGFNLTMHQYQPHLLIVKAYLLVKDE